MRDRLTLSMRASHLLALIFVAAALALAAIGDEQRADVRRAVCCPADSSRQRLPPVPRAVSARPTGRDRAGPLGAFCGLLK